MFMRLGITDPELFEEAKEFFKGKGVDLLTSESLAPSELVLFYLSRMNSKLDNLGQLRHLVKVEKHLSTVANFSLLASTWYKYEIDAMGARMMISKAYYKQKCEEAGETPIPPHVASWLTIAEIDDIFNKSITL